MSSKNATYLAFVVTAILQTGAIGGEYKACTSVPATGSDCKGENYSCGEGCVKCGTVNVGAPSGQTITSVQGQGPGRGWWTWEQSPSASGNSASGRAKNWSHDQALQACIVIQTE